jgi:Domain of unknown function (DUF4261)
MGILERFFGKRGADAAPPALVANESLKSRVGLQLLFSGELDLEPAAVTRALRKYHSTMAAASCEIDATAAGNGTPIGLLGWGRHVMKIVGFDVPMPSEVVEKCVQGAHYGADLKAKARAHKSHVLLYYAGQETGALEQYVALAAACGVLSRFGAIVVLNEAGHTSLPAAVLAGGEGDILELLHSLPIPMLYSGFVKFDVEGVKGVWMRTFGNHLLGLPDFAHLAKGHHEGEATFEMICHLLSYLQSSGATFAPGHTMQVGDDTFLKARAPAKEEYFLESDGELLVLEKISASETNQP